MGVPFRDLSLGVGFQNLGNSGTAITVSWSVSRRAYVTLTGNVTSVTFSAAPPDGEVLELVILTGAGGFTVAGWPVTVKWPGGTAPTITAAASKTDVIQLVYRSSGPLYYGSFLQNY